jgi:hypothetical protein
LIWLCPCRLLWCTALAQKHSVIRTIASPLEWLPGLHFFAAGDSAQIDLSFNSFFKCAFRFFMWNIPVECRSRCFQCSRFSEITASDLDFEKYGKVRFMLSLEWRIYFRKLFYYLNPFISANLICTRLNDLLILSLSNYHMLVFC